MRKNIGKLLVLGILAVAIILASVNFASAIVWNCDDYAALCEAYPRYGGYGYQEMGFGLWGFECRGYNANWQPIVLFTGHCVVKSR